MSKAKKPKTQHRRQPVKLAHGKTYADVLSERRSAERLQAFVDSANQAAKALSAAAQQINEAKAKINELRNIEEEKKQQAEPGRWPERSRRKNTESNTAAVSTFTSFALSTREAASCSRWMK